MADADDDRAAGAVEVAAALGVEDLRAAPAGGDRLAGAAAREDVLAHSATAATESPKMPQRGVRLVERHHERRRHPDGALAALQHQQAALEGLLLHGGGLLGRCRNSTPIIRPTPRTSVTTRG